MSVAAAKPPANAWASRVAAAVGILWLTSAATPTSAAPRIGERAPTLVLSELDGKTFDLAKLRGQVVLVNYWATWCAPCRKEMPTLDAFYRRHHDEGFEMIGISIDFPRDVEKMRRAAAAVTYPTAVASAITDDGFGPPGGVPLSYLIDADGLVRDMFIAAPNKLLDDVVVPLLPRHAASGGGSTP